jgi:hypothetical protein
MAGSIKKEVMKRRLSIHDLNVNLSSPPTAKKYKWLRLNVINRLLARGRFLAHGCLISTPKIVTILNIRNLNAIFSSVIGQPLQFPCYFLSQLGFTAKTRLE